MRITAFGAACIVSGIIAVGLPSSGRAQATDKGKLGTFSGAATVGATGYGTEPNAQDKGKFLEYRDLKPGAVLEQFLLKYTPRDTFGLYQIGGRNLTTTDRSVWGQATRPGLFDLQARYEGIPHTYSTTARTLETETTPGVFTLPSPRPDSIAWRKAPYLDPVRNTWNAMKLSLGLTPTTTLDSKLEYTRIAKSGSKPLSLSFAGSSGPTIEFPSPVDETVSNLKLAQSYSNKTFQVTGSYAYSSFTNKNRFAEIASPLNTTDTPTNGAAFARIALPPDNAAKTAMGMGAVNLPYKTRLMATAAMSWFTQNALFVPQTSNSLLITNPLVALPRTSLDGQAKTSNVSVSLASHPYKDLRLAARFRSFDYSNSTAPFHISAMVLADRSVNLADTATSAPLPFTKSNTDISANYLLLKSLSLTAAYGWENWTRDIEEWNIAKTNEGTSRFSLDYTGIEWVTLRGSYSKGERRGDGYRDSTDAFDFPGFRRFDQGWRNRDRKALEAMFTPTDQINVALSWQDWRDTFPVAYGAQTDKSNMLGADLDWSPSNRFSIGGGYSIENTDYVLKSRYKTGNRGTPLFDNSTYIWFSVDKGKSTVSYLSFTAALIPNKLDAGGSISSSNSKFDDHNYNPNTPSGGTNAQNYAATAYDFPQVWSKKSPLELHVSYRYSDWGVSLRYQLETYRQSDFRTLNPDCYDKTTPAAPVAVDPQCINSNYNIPPGADLAPSIGTFKFLGDNYHNYRAGWFTMTFSYRPSAMPFTRGRSTL